MPVVPHKRNILAEPGCLWSCGHDLCRVQCTACHATASSFMLYALCVQADRVCQSCGGEAFCRAYLFALTPELAKTCLWNSVGTQISSMVLHRRSRSGLNRSVSNIVRPTRNACPGFKFLGGQLLGLPHSKLGTDQDPAEHASMAVPCDSQVVASVMLCRTNLPGLCYRYTGRCQVFTGCAQP